MHMNRALFLSVTFATTLVAFIFPHGALAQPKPNIIFIMTDDQRWDALSCMGHPFFKSPNIDRIANEGAKFTNYFVTIPLCSPSRGVILTGQYSHKNGIIDNSNRNEQSFKLATFPQVLQKAGYETAF